ncbi:hypothetical protein ARGLB_080_00290 [Arthrobacter globiformis NBRC 12137]|uniref:Uncharacterized protein n=1 Tax=Arthrobacter globiformis (strain ATCC 8010 / DSM 20124 / JCM 1332 / NBRC 12137 / NCIMB 8907 / NRRL B-2979 / 168) TaxID=1077972 RepID=H0QQ64_ARTG1|nr:hypothetical protein [Arthrobacter globiformis]GAB14965.1 hypothetical protein ARGLB_080_00290 [Arthrobacter globiformis NBRC 12137]
MDATLYLETPARQGRMGVGMAPEVRETCERIYQEATGASEAEADAWMDEVERTHGRYVADIFT